MFTNSIRSLLCRGYEPKHQEGHRVRNDLLGQNRSISSQGCPWQLGSLWPGYGPQLGPNDLLLGITDAYAETA